MQHDQTTCRGPVPTKNALAARGEPMRGSEGRPLDPASAAELVVRVVCELDQRREAQSNALLSDLLCAAWPTRWAQDQ
jgi:hypothetical protein